MSLQLFREIVHFVFQGPIFRNMAVFRIGQWNQWREIRPENLSLDIIANKLSERIRFHQLALRHFRITSKFVAPAVHNFPAEVAATAHNPFTNR